jgi:hypothetical protein
VAAIAKLISLDGALTPVKLCMRIGKSQRWVRDRMTITVVPARWLDAISEGRLTLAQAVADGPSWRRTAHCAVKILIHNGDDRALRAVADHASE